MAGYARKGIADYTHRIVLCSGYDEIAGAAQVFQSKYAIAEVWACIKEVRTTFHVGSRGTDVEEGKDRYSHNITIRWRPDLNITGHAWVYEKRVKTGGRWWKVIGIKETDESQLEFVLQARLAEKSDFVAAPTAPAPTSGATPLPAGVRL